MGKIYGYIRVLSADQDVDGQVAMLREMQVADRDIFIDRPDKEDGFLQYQSLLKKLKSRDLLYMNSLDMLGYDYGEIGKQWRLLTKEKKVDVVVLDLPPVDTRRGKTQYGTLVSDVVLSMLEYASNMEWLARKQRQKAGIERAKSRGVQFGRILRRRTRCGGVRKSEGETQRSFVIFPALCFIKGRGF
ncbi:MAG: recombinase family protein [Lachnospiraceae bacterium]|nr:recombinase family protein [Lachnospiraceae bacterium]